MKVKADRDEVSFAITVISVMHLIQAMFDVLKTQKHLMKTTLAL